MTPILDELSFVIPAYNEEPNIRELVSGIGRVAPSVTARYEIVVVNDGSTDGTQRVAEELSRADPSVVLVSHERNLGFARTIRDGLASARYGHAFYTDADLQFDMDEIRQLLPYTDEYDFVVGYRLHRADPLIRRASARIYNAAVRLAFGVRLRDIDCAFKPMRTDVIRSLEVRSDSAFYFAELMHRATVAGVRIREVPVRHYPRRHGAQTGGRPSVICKALVDMLSYAISSRRDDTGAAYTHGSDAARR